MIVIDELHHQCGITERGSAREEQKSLRPEVKKEIVKLLLTDEVAKRGCFNDNITSKRNFAFCHVVRNELCVNLVPQRIQYLPLYGVVLTLYFVSPFFILTIKRFVIYFLAHYKTKNLYNYCNFLINALQLHEFIFTYLQTISSLPFGMLRNFRRWTWGLFQWSYFWHLTLSSWCLVNCFSLNNIFSNRSLVQKTDWKVSSF